MGSSILIGGISTFLGILPLAFSSSEIFTTIFLTFLGLVVLGCGHGLILVPVILSTIGPEDEIRKGPRKSLEHQVSTVSVDAESNA
jgi:Niemann-Pick C1 protein